MKPIPERFRVAKKTLLFDKFMNNFIVVGGLGIILAVFGIFIFILAEIIPLFDKAEVKQSTVFEAKLPANRVIGLGVDEWCELPVAILDDASLLYTDLLGTRGTFEKKLPLDASDKLTCVNYVARKQELIVGTNDGRVAVAELKYATNFLPSGQRVIEPDVQLGEMYPVLDAKTAVTLADFGGKSESQLILAVGTTNGKQIVKGVTLKQKRSLFGKGKVEVDTDYDFSNQVKGTVKDIDVSIFGESFMLTMEDGTLQFFAKEGETFPLRQIIKPFESFADKEIVKGEYLLGDATFVVSNKNGDIIGYSSYLAKGAKNIQFAHTKTFEKIPGVLKHFTSCLRNKAFLIAGEKYASIRYGTTEDTRWEKKLDFDIQSIALSGKYEKMLFMDSEGRLHKYDITDHHPESGFQAFFGKIWYEGQPEADYIWQSTGGTDDFEPKLSLIPLIIGSLKGTFYALLFAVPISLIAALYTSQFVTPDVKRIVKPTVEIMASLPSVVLGFLAALWLAPIVDRQVPSFLLMIIVVPTIVLFFGWLWQQFPVYIRVKLPVGMEFAIAIPLIFLGCYLCTLIGPEVEKIFFVVTDPTTGKKVADFRLWWPETMGIPYTQRNALVVGFVMGFAVIPIIFTISEDAMSNVPKSLRSGSLALGASRWQTAINIVLPTAAAGIFSAVMIGFGRAVGETMIVVMATGNTAVMDMNIFSGMRTLSANTAVEIPEAPQHSTLYRGLFLGAMVLFLITFAVNTIAEVMRQKLRERYKTVE